MHDTPAFLEIAERVAAAALAPDEWQPALSRLATLLDAGHIIISARDKRAAATPLIASAGVDERDLARSIAAWGQGAKPALPSGVPVVRSRLISDAEYEATALYNEVTRPLNGWHGILVEDRRNAHQFELAVCRPRTAEDFNAHGLEAVRLLLPHVAVSLDLHYRLAAERARSDSLLGLVERLDEGVVLVDGGGTVVFANRRADRLLAEADGLILACDRLAAPDPAVHRRLRAAVSTLVAGNGPGQAAEAIRVVVPRSPGRMPLLVHALPVGSGLSAGGQKLRAALFISDTGASPPVSRAALAEAYGLTQRETEVALLLAEGLSPEEIAASTGVRLASLRQYLKRIFDKTGKRRQAALVALIRGFRDPLH